MRFIEKYKDVLNKTQYQYGDFLSRIKHGAVVLASAGSGKTLMTLMTPIILGEKEFIIIVPAKSLNDIKAECEKFSSLIPELANMQNRIYSSSTLSSSNARLLETINPRLIVIDEVQDFADVNTARGKRFFRYLDANLKRTRLVCMSATLVTLQFKQFFYLMAYALRESSPFLMNEKYVQAYQTLLDGTMLIGDKKTEEAKKSLDRFVGSTYVEKMGSAIVGCSHVFTNFVNSTDVPILFKKVTKPESPEIQEALARLEAEWALPNGELVTDAAVINHAVKTLGCGYYFTTTHEDGTAALLRAKDTIAQFNKAARRSVTYEDGVDSLGVFKKLKASEGRLHTLMTKADEQKKKLIRETVFIDSAFMVALVKRVLDKTDNLAIWVEHVEAGEFLSKHFNIPFFRDGKKRVPITAKRAIFSSKAFYAGKNLQQFNNAFLLEPTVNPLIFEQLISRHHRYGQTKPVTIYFNGTNKQFMAQWIRLRKRSTKLGKLYKRKFKFE